MSTTRLIGTTLGMASIAWLLWQLGGDREQIGAALLHPQQLVDTAGADQLVLVLTTALAWAAWAWGALGLLLALATTVPGAAGRAAAALLSVALPAGARRTAAVLLGVTLTAGGPLFASVVAAVPAAASTESSSTAATTERSADTPAAQTRAGADLGAPDWPGGTAADGGDTAAAAVPDWPATPDGAHVVLRGDCLWDIAERWLGAAQGEPSAAQTAVAVQQWWAANASVIGPDPDVLLPGQVLTPPP